MAALYGAISIEKKDSVVNQQIIKKNLEKARLYLEIKKTSLKIKNTIKNKNSNQNQQDNHDGYIDYYFEEDQQNEIDEYQIEEDHLVFLENKLKCKVNKNFFFAFILSIFCFLYYKPKGQNCFHL